MKNWTTIITVFCVIALFVGIRACVNNYKIQVSEIDAELDSEEYVEKLVSSPEKEFGVAEVVRIDGKTFSVKSHVDYYNLFGSKIRSYYKCNVEYSEDFKIYTITEFQITE